MKTDLSNYENRIAAVAVAVVVTVAAGCAAFGVVISIFINKLAQ